MKFPPVQPFPDDAFTRVLCVVAHPDDVEYGTSSAVAAWTAKGIEVAYLLLTRGEAGIDTMDPKATAELRIREQIKGSHEVGVTQVDFLEYPDGVLEYSIAMRRDIARAIRSFRPDALVVTAWGVEFPFGLNQVDHRVAGLAAVDAMRDAANRWVFPELLDGGLEPHSTRWLITNGFENATHGVDISGEPLERGIASLEAHAEYLAAIPGHPAPRDMISGFTALQGKAMGSGMRSCFEHGIRMRVQPSWKNYRQPKKNHPRRTSLQFIFGAKSEAGASPYAGLELTVGASLQSTSGPFSIAVPHPPRSE